MRFSALALSALLLSAGISAAQTGFSTKTYPAVLPASSDNTRLLTADLNGDGRPDLVSYGSRYTGTAPVNVFLNNGSGGLLPPTALAGSSGMLVQAGDMNGDGYPDIVGCKNVGSGAGQTVSVTVYLNNKTGGFTAQPAVTGIGNSECNAVVLGDVFQNGHLDVVTVGYTPGQYNPGGTFFPGNTNDIQVFSNNNGTGTLTFKGSLSTSLDDPSNNTFTNCGAIDAVGADFLQDGKFDLMVTTTCPPSGQNLPGNVGTSFLITESTDQYGNEFYGPTKYLQSQYANYIDGKVYDVNGDGRPDVLFNAVEGGNYPDDLILAKNNGNGSFSFSSLFQGTTISSSNTGGATVADFNGDGINDVAASYNNTQSPPIPTVSILAGTTSGTFTVSQSFATGTGIDSAGDVVAADFNGDGRPDLATLVFDNNTRTTSLNVYTNTQSGGSSACSAPTTANTICSPASGATLNSPVTVNAASNVAGFTLNRLYLDNTSVYQTTSQTVSTPINAATGSHRLVLVSYNNKGQAFTSAVDFNVGTATGGGCVPTSPGVSICSPANGSTHTPPVTITAGAMAQSGYITAMRVYVDNNADYTVYNHSATKTFSFTQGAFDFGQGAHHLVIVAYESTGGALTSAVNFSEPTGPCTPPAGGTSLRICSPASQGTISSPVTVSAGADAAGTYIAAIRAYVDNNPVALYTNTQKSATFYVNQPLSIGSGKHYFVLVGYPANGGSVTASEYITIK